MGAQCARPSKYLTLWNESKYKIGLIPYWDPLHLAHCLSLLTSTNTIWTMKCWGRLDSKLNCQYSVFLSTRGRFEYIKWRHYYSFFYNTRYTANKKNHYKPSVRTNLGKRSTLLLPWTFGSLFTFAKKRQTLSTLWTTNKIDFRFTDKATYFMQISRMPKSSNLIG